MTRGRIALGDREQAGQPRLGCQQVVAVGVEYVLHRGITDGQQLALGVQQEGEVHVERQRAGLLRQGLPAGIEAMRRGGE